MEEYKPAVQSTMLKTLGYSHMSVNDTDVYAKPLPIIDQSGAALLLAGWNP